MVSNCVLGGNLAVACKVDGKMVCWNNRGKKLAVITSHGDDEKYMGCNIVLFNM